MTVPARATTAGLALLVLLTASCSNDPGRPSMDPLTELRSRPSYQQAVATYTAMQREIEAATVAAVPGITWLPADKGIESFCGTPFDKLDGSRTSLDTTYIEGGIPDAGWPAALAAVTAVTARYGLTDVTVRVDQPGRHDVTLVNPTDGTYASLGTDVNASILVSTGCNLPEALLQPTSPAGLQPPSPTSTTG